MNKRLFNLLETKYKKFNRLSFIDKDPIRIPHFYSKKEDIELSAFFTAIISWGNRTSIIKNAEQLFKRMDNAPFDFIINHSENDLKKMKGFVHRTFNETDLFYIIEALKFNFESGKKLEELFIDEQNPTSVKHGLINFHNSLFSLEFAPQRTRKHISTPIRGSACKRLNMFLRWMVRKDSSGVDFGIWTKIQPSSLICPLDVHVGNVARNLGLITINKDNWMAAEELTSNLRLFDPRDPVKYDFSLFGMGIESKQSAK